MDQYTTSEMMFSRMLGGRREWKSISGRTCSDRQRKSGGRGAERQFVDAFRGGRMT